MTTSAHPALSHATPPQSACDVLKPATLIAGGDDVDRSGVRNRYRTHGIVRDPTGHTTTERHHE